MAQKRNLNPIIQWAADHARIRVREDGKRQLTVPLAPLVDGTYQGPHAPQWAAILEEHAAIVSAQDQPYRWLLSVGQLATLWRDHFRHAHALRSFVALFCDRDGKPYAAKNLKQYGSTADAPYLPFELADALTKLDTDRIEAARDRRTSTPSDPDDRGGR